MTFFRFFSIPIFLLFILSCKTQQPVLSNTSSFLPIQDTIGSVPVKTAMDPRIKETSGLKDIGGNLYTHNDSGGENKLYQLSDHGKIIHEVILDNSINKDWESLAADGTHFYVGNFGNNLGKRSDLKIYRGSINDLVKKDTVSMEEISFRYEDQTKFYSGYNHNFDGEALISFQNHLYIFSKNWLDKKCKIYRLPKQPGEHIAVKIGEFDTKGLITGADIRSDQKEIVLIGYRHNIITREFFPFIISLSRWQDDQFFSGSVIQRPLSISMQTEAISFRNGTDIWLTSENEGDGNPAIFILKTRN